MTKFGIALCAAAAAFVACSNGATYSNPVIPGDYPDPSVIRVGHDYYATATTSEWAPLFPILHSRDLVNWESLGAVFQRRPEWSAGNFWAPEISEWKGRYFVYYVARKRNGPLSVAVASAAQPAGPYTDHGPFISQDAGSIDPVPVVDVKGDRWLIWKEDGNSRNLPTPLWIARLSSDGTKLAGEMKEVLRNDAPWEGRVVEGPFVIRHGERYYLFYAGNACCGRGCHYGVGVARAKDLLGPWEKNPKNPILADNETWKCPGHGSVVEDEKGNAYLMYHAYSARDFIYVGRQALLDQIEWGGDGWPTINQGHGPSSSSTAPFSITAEHSQLSFKDDFRSPTLNPEWQWPQSIEPRWKIESSPKPFLKLGANEARGTNLLGAVLAVKTSSGNYTAETVLDRAHARPGTSLGFSAFGDMDNALGLAVEGSNLLLWRRQRGKHETLLSRPISETELLYVRINASNGHKFRFSISPDGAEWNAVGDHIDLEGEFLPPWDRGIRIALTVGGAPEAEGWFYRFSLAPTDPTVEHK